MNKNTVLSNDIKSAVFLFAEFGERGHYERKGRVIIMNDVTDPKGEGIFLARCARRVARDKGVNYAYEWAMKQFTEGAYNRLQARNKPRSCGRFELRKYEKELEADLMSCLPKQA